MAEQAIEDEQSQKLGIVVLIDFFEASRRNVNREFMAMVSV